MTPKLARALIDWLREAGAGDIQLGQGGKHPRITFSWLGHPRFYVLPNREGHHRSFLNAISNLRHELGLLHRDDPAPTPKPQPKVGGTRSQKECGKLRTTLLVTTRPGWQSALECHPLATPKSGLPLGAESARPPLAPPPTPPAAPAPPSSAQPETAGETTTPAAVVPPPAAATEPARPARLVGQEAMMTAATTAERAYSQTAVARRHREADAAKAANKESRNFLPEALDRARAKLKACFAKGDYAELMLIDPAMAKVMLERNELNRKFKWGAIVRYKSYLERGEWKKTGETIAFSEAGALLNGQNRLESILQCRVPMETWVVFGCDRDAFKVTDSGEIRQTKDMLFIMSQANPHLLSPALKQLGQYLAGEWSFRETINNFQCEELLRQHPEIRASIPVGQGIRQQIKGVAGTPYTVLHYVFGQIDKEAADAFFTNLKFGLNAKRGDPEYVLRELLIKEGGTFRGHTAEIYRAIIRAWNAKRKGRSVTRNQLVNGLSGETTAFPEPV